MYIIIIITIVAVVVVAIFVVVVVVVVVGFVGFVIIITGFNWYNNCVVIVEFVFKFGYSSTIFVIVNSLLDSSSNLFFLRQDSRACSFSLLDSSVFSMILGWISSSLALSLLLFLSNSFSCRFFLR